MTINLETATSAELKQWKMQLLSGEEEIPPSVLAELDGLIVDRAVDERLDKAMTRVQEVESSKKYDEMARTRYPELKDETSDFYKKVNEFIGEDKSPRALLNAANEVSVQMFGKGPHMQPPQGKIAPGNSDSGSDDEHASEKFFTPEKTKIAEAFAGEGLLDLANKESMDRIAERASEED